MTSPLVLCWIVVVLGTCAALAARRRAPWLRLILSLLSVVALTVVLVPLVGSTLQPQFGPDDPVFRAWSEKLFVAVWWLLVARIVIVTGQIAMRINHRHHAARLASDLAAGAVYLGAVLAIIDLAFGVSVTGLVATSGIIAIVLGLALQNTLGDLFSGIAIGVDRPFGVGDIIWIEGSIEGRVIETNWRSTRIATASNDIATVPNSVVARSRIQNRSFPSDIRTDTVKVVLDPQVPPEVGIGLLRGAALNTAALAADPGPAVVCIELRGEGAVYEIGFSAPLPRFRDARSDLLQQVSRHARYAGVALAPQNGLPLVPVAMLDVPRLVSEVALLQDLTDDERASLAEHLVRHQGGPGHSLFSQGGALSSMFIIAGGAFAVSRDDGGGHRRLGTIGPGDYFGELSLLTGAANAATVTALTPFLAYEVTHTTIAPMLRQNPGLLQAFEAGASKARALLDRTIAAQACSSGPSKAHLIDHIRTFFNIVESPSFRHGPDRIGRA